MKAISHQNTACQKVTECGSCGGLAPCGLQPDAGTRPVIYSSKDKHGGYAVLATCNHILSCLDACAAGERLNVPMVNAGEPDAHFTENLTDGGFINAANGWTKPQLYDHNPWDLTRTSARPETSQAICSTPPSSPPPATRCLLLPADPETPTAGC